MKRKYFIFSALLIVSLAISGVAFPWGSASGDGKSYGAIQETGVFQNVSGATLSAGQIVVIDTASGTAGTTLGAQVTTTTTADDSGIVGVVQQGQTCLDDQACVIVTKGPVDTLILDSSDPISTGSIVSTGTTAGYGSQFDGTCNGGGFSNCEVGQALEAGDGTDTGKAYIYVNP